MTLRTIRDNCGDVAYEVVPGRFWYAKDRETAENGR